MGWFKDSKGTEKERKEMDREVEYASLKGKLEAALMHIEWLGNHIERHGNARKAAEERLDKMYGIFERLVANSADAEMFKKLLEKHLDKK